MSIQNYGKSGYGFRCSTTDYNRVKAFIKKYLCAHDQQFFEGCKSIEDIRAACGERDDFSDGYCDACGILAYVIHDKVHHNVAYCHDDYNFSCILMLPSMPWDQRYVKPITQEDFEQKAGALAEEFFGSPVKFDWHTTEEWG